MPISLSAKKSLRKSRHNRKANVLFKSEIKKVTKKFLAKPNSGNLKELYSILDKAVKKNIFHKNKVSRLKSNYSKKVEDKGVKKSTSKKPVTKKTVKKSKKM